MKIPYYVFAGFGVDAFFVDKVSAPQDRICLVTGLCAAEEKEGLPPLDFSRVLFLLEEGYSSLRVGKEPLSYRDIVGGLYNPSVYIGRREKEIVANSLSRIYMSLYERVFKLMENHAHRLVWYVAELKHDKVYICGELSKPYTTLYVRDKKFKENFDLYAKSE